MMAGGSPPPPPGRPPAGFLLRRCACSQIKGMRAKFAPLRSPFRPRPLAPWRSPLGSARARSGLRRAVAAPVPGLGSLAPPTGRRPARRSAAARAPRRARCGCRCGGCRLALAPLALVSLVALGSLRAPWRSPSAAGGLPGPPGRLAAAGPPGPPRRAAASLVPRSLPPGGGLRAPLLRRRALGGPSGPLLGASGPASGGWGSAAAAAGPSDHRLPGILAAALVSPWRSPAAWLRSSGRIGQGNIIRPGGTGEGLTEYQICANLGLWSSGGNRSRIHRTGWSRAAESFILGVAAPV